MTLVYWRMFSFIGGYIVIIGGYLHSLEDICYYWRIFHSLEDILAFIGGYTGIHWRISL
jgi:hypothetical protein